MYKVKNCLELVECGMVFMVFRYRVNGVKFWKKILKDFLVEECEIIIYLDFDVCEGDIGSDLFFFNLFLNVVFVVVCCVFIICYWNFCKGEFVFDDFEVIVSNKDL